MDKNIDYQQKFKKYYTRYNAAIMMGGDCKYVDTKECGILDTGRCGLVEKDSHRSDSDSDISSNENQCICNDVSGYCVKKMTLRGLRVMVSKLEDKLKSGEVVSLPTPPSPASTPPSTEKPVRRVSPLEGMLKTRQMASDDPSPGAHPLAAMIKKRQVQMEGTTEEPTDPETTPPATSAKVSGLERRLKFGQPVGVILIDINKYLDDPTTSKEDREKLEKLKSSISSKARVDATGSSGLDKLINKTNSGLLENKAKALAETKERAGGDTFLYDNTIDLYEEIMSFQTKDRLTPESLIANIKELYEPIRDKINPQDLESWDKQFQKLQKADTSRDPLQDKATISNLLYGVKGMYKGLLSYLEKENKERVKDISNQEQVDLIDINEAKKLLAKLRVALDHEDKPIDKKDQQIEEVYNKLDKIQQNKVIKDLFGKLKGDKDLRLMNRASLFSDNNLNLVRPDLQKTVISDKVDTENYGLPDIRYLDEDDDDTEKKDITRKELIKQQDEYFTPPYKKADPTDKRPKDWDDSQGEWKPREIEVDNCSTYFNEKAKGPYAGPEWTAKMKKRECKLCKEVLTDKNNFYDPTSKFCVNCCRDLN